MIRKMLSKTAGYVSEALNCDVILLASVFNPCYRLSMINLWYPSHALYVQGSLEEKYQERKIAYESKLPKACTSAVEKKSDRKHHIVDEVNFFPAAAQGSSENELTVYISGRYKLPTSEASNCLTWWKDHCHKFPVVAMLARDYLASCATSASVERCFLAAADICGCD
ncbi:hypothetical protein PSTG_10467 [Puccinia striiformis f. sp. tritici PST-78]|uniref:HAT C-terminal dimerisation domain-containing protein n=1 Tax=Puccinia striiformis f. sp. tritici PST-78 TaxID=1165861 RepID=A0A0L0VA90_9BASI|nr:hypothetical protein PSTG_10467 [Puccinia striiformis f. sp. tritici PST-78]